MGEAKRRGTREERVKQAIERKQKNNAILSHTDVAVVIGKHIDPDTASRLAVLSGIHAGIVLIDNRN